MSQSKVPTQQFLAGSFVISAGCILFRRQQPQSPLQVCILYHTISQEYLLPKGRRDLEERTTIAALRETYEETGYEICGSVDP
jgi:8-oxo-dGTP pyrophosphatase MutT (NUDIX family)